MSRVLRNDVKTVLVSYQCPTKLLRHCKSRVHLEHRVAPSNAFTHHARQCGTRTSGLVFRCIFGGHSRGFATNIQSPLNGGNAAVPAAGVPTSPLAIVFTDIVKSTVLWEKDSASMDEAMDIHDNLIREEAAKFNGYEVKQNGDGFMFAFQSPISALEFCLNTQVRLQEQKWPENLLKLGPTKPVLGVGPKQEEEVLLWNGLRLRISAHYGEAVCKWNEVINRMDYLGPSVNRAARFVSVCEAGQIVVSQEFLEEVEQARKNAVGGTGPLFDGVQTRDMNQKDFDLKELQSDDVSEKAIDSKFEVRLLGERHFKGIPEDQRLYFILPKSLRGRLDYMPKQRYVAASKGNLLGDG